MTLLQLWLFVGIPALVLGLGLFVGRSRWRSLAGYAVLLVAFGVMVASHPPSSAVLGSLVALLYASGRGGDIEGEYDPVSDTGHRAVEAQSLT